MSASPGTAPAYRTKIAVAGKGGVGKTTLTALIAEHFGRRGHRVVAVDADPVAHLAGALGIAAADRRKIVPISQMRELVEERTGARDSGMFVVNPRVDDLLVRFGTPTRPGVTHLQLGTLEIAGGGCFCPQSALLRALLRHIVLDAGDVVLLDLEAGLEPLGRSTIERMDWVIVVVEPGARSVETAARIRDLARQIGLTRVGAVVNKVRTPSALAAATAMLDRDELPVLGHLPFDERLGTSDLDDRAVAEGLGGSAIDARVAELMEVIARGPQEAHCR